MKYVIVLTKKIIFFLIFSIFFLSSSNSQSNEVSLLNLKKNLCNDIKFNEDLSNIKNLQIKFKNYRKWSKNGLTILNHKKANRFITEKSKKRYSANLIIYYNDGKICSYKSKIRQNGDHFDHIKFEDGNIIQSLDVHLSEGNILGVTKFKLFIPETRNANEEIIVSQLMKSLGYISPKTFFLKTRINNFSTKFLFQEKASKELIESYLFKDAPIYEGNEKLVIGTSKNKNTIFNKKMTFVRQINDKWINSDLTEKISVEGLTKLNEVYFTNISNLMKKNQKVDQLTLDYKKLANGQKEQYEYLVGYDALLNSVNGGHALIPHNRKFYFDPYSKKFYPIFYDASPGSANRNLITGWSTKIKELKINEFKWGISKNSIIGSSIILKNLEDLDLDVIYKKTKLNGVKYSKKEYLEIINSIKQNLKTISKVKNNDRDNYNINLTDYIEKIKDDTIEFYTYFKFKKDLFKCESYLENCRNINLDIVNFRKLINGDLNYKNKKALFLGNVNLDNKQINLDASTQNYYKEYNFNSNSNKIKIKSSKNSIIDFDSKKNLLKIDAFDNDWVVIEKSNLNNITIDFKKTNKKKFVKKENRFNDVFLTGCLNIFNSNFKAINFKIYNADCEDALNIVKSNGTISSIYIEKSDYDGLDVDYSNLKFDKIFIKNSNNDCVDFSNGNYEIKFININNCKDKGISIGEKSKVFFEEMKVLHSNIGVASKDGSITEINDIKIDKTENCLAAYNKKNEFDGGMIKIETLKCTNFNNKLVVDGSSLINIKNSIVVE